MFSFPQYHVLLPKKDMYKSLPEEAKYSQFFRILSFTHHIYHLLKVMCQILAIGICAMESVNPLMVKFFLVYCS